MYDIYRDHIKSEIERTNVLVQADETTGVM
jgi:hypothetical protein